MYNWHLGYHGSLESGMCFDMRPKIYDTGSSMSLLPEVRKKISLLADGDRFHKFLKNSDFCLTTSNQSGLNSFLDCSLELGELEIFLDLMAHKALVTLFKQVYFKVLHIPPQNKMGRPVTTGYSLVQGQL